MAEDDRRHEKVVLSEPELRVYISDWNGETAVHLRKFVETAKYSGPTKQGVRIPIDNVLEAVQGLLDVYATETGIRFVLDEVGDASQ